MSLQQDKYILLDSFFLTYHHGKKPSIAFSEAFHLPGWTKDRFEVATQSLIDDNYIVAPHQTIWFELSITALGIREAKQRAAPMTTQNITIGTNHNSPIQQVGAYGSATQTASYQINKNDLSTIVDLYHKHAEELGLDAANRRRADAQIATIEAQLGDEPDPTIIKAAGKSLKAIIENALGGAVGTAISNPEIWTRIISILG